MDIFQHIFLWNCQQKYFQDMGLHINQHLNQRMCFGLLDKFLHIFLQIYRHNSFQDIQVRKALLNHQRKQLEQYLDIDICNKFFHIHNNQLYKLKYTVEFFNQRNQFYNLINKYLLNFMRIKVGDNKVGIICYCQDLKKFLLGNFLRRDELNHVDHQKILKIEGKLVHIYQYCYLQIFPQDIFLHISMLNHLQNILIDSHFNIYLLINLRIFLLDNFKHKFYLTTLRIIRVHQDI